MVFGEFGHGDQVIDVFAIHDHRVDLGGDAVFQQGVKGVHHFFEHIATGDFKKTIGIQSIHTQVDRFDADGF